MITLDSLKTYLDKDIDRSLFLTKKVAIIGYGSQGYGQANNLRDSNVNVCIGCRIGGKSYQKALNDGFEVISIEDAVKNSDIIQILIPDEVQAKVYEKNIKPHLKEGQYLMFAHGFNICFDKIKVPKNINVIMVAPKGAGYMVRAEFLKSRGTAALIAIEQDYTGNSKQIALGFASCLGCGKTGIIETTFHEEAVADLFSEQTILCGGVISLIKSGFETLVNKGINPKIAYFECLHELKLIADLLYEKGIAGMNYSISNTAEYGGLTRGDRLINEQTKVEMDRIFDEINSGQFADEWINEYNQGGNNFKSLEQRDENLLIEKIGAEIRSMFDWKDEKIIK